MTGDHCRATQTGVTGRAVAAVQTDPPPRANFCQTVSQWVIHNHYEQVGWLWLV